MSTEVRQTTTMYKFGDGSGYVEQCVRVQRPDSCLRHRLQLFVRDEPAKLLVVRKATGLPKQLLAPHAIVYYVGRSSTGATQSVEVQHIVVENWNWDVVLRWHVSIIFKYASTSK